MSAYYNEIDPQCAEWLRNLIKAGHIADGEVDNRSILDVSPTDLKGFSQCHFFAGIGVWSRALRLAGWRDDQRVWTGSCPCQPFSAAGVRGGFADERHLWPAFFHLIEQCAPPTVFGEQVASKDGLNWIDLVHADMEGAGYTFGATDLCAAGVGAPHIRQRLWFVGSRLADAELHGYLTGTVARSLSARESQGRLLQLEGRSAVERVADTGDAGSQGRVSGRQDARRESIDGYAGRGSAIERLGDTESDGPEVRGDVYRELPREGFAKRCHVSGLADASEEQFYGGGESGATRRRELADYSDLIGLANPHDDQHEPQRRSDGFENGEAPSDGQNVAVTWQLGGTSDALCGLADASSDGYSSAPRSAHVRRVEQFERRAEEPAECVEPSAACSTEFRRLERASTRPTNGFWRDADWLFCRDGKWRPVRPGAQQMVDGSTQSLGRLRPDQTANVETAVQKWSERYQKDASEAVRDLWDLLSTEEAVNRTDGGFDSVREAPFLLAFLRQLSDQGWKFEIGHERTSSEASRRALRVLRYEREPSYSSRQRGLDEQSPYELTDPLRQLSQILAHHAEDCWGKAGWQDVGSFPLIEGAPSRVVRLRAYGNAINAEVAATFIEAATDGLLGLDLI